MIDRTQAPAIKTLDKIDFIEPKIIPIHGDTKLIWMKKVPNQTARVEFQFDAGTIRGDKKMASFTNSLIFSGTDKNSSIEIQEKFNELGTYLDYECGQEVAIIGIYCLTENIQASTNLMIDSIKNVQFHEEEVIDLLRERKQDFLVSIEKVNTLSRRKFQELLFENSDLYTRQLNIEDYDSINIEKIKEFHQNYYLKGLKKIVVVSDCEEAFINDLINSVKDWYSIHEEIFESQFKYLPQKVHVQKDKAIQTAIRIGMPIFNKTHEDFIDLQILQTILGDYFGSRLMSNIREDKGYTYGIGSGIVEMMRTGYFIIGTEVGTEVSDATLQEIQYELDRLKNELIPDDELNLVKNYLLGQLLKAADGPNAMVNLYLGVEGQNLNFDFYNKLINRIQNITSEELMVVAKKYLNWNNMIVVTAGDKK